MFQGSAWIGVIGADSMVTTYNVTAGQVIFFPRNTVHWIKNVGSEDCVFLLFFTTHEELQTLDVDDAFFSTPEDFAARALKVCLMGHHLLSSPLRYWLKWVPWEPTGWRCPVSESPMVGDVP